MSSDDLVEWALAGTMAALALLLLMCVIGLGVAIWTGAIKPEAQRPVQVQVLPAEKS